MSNSNGKVTAKKKGTVAITAKTKAKEYLNYMAFSYDGLVKQLKNEGFTTTQISYGVKSVGY